jgi:hypothetical protein
VTLPFLVCFTQVVGEGLWVLFAFHAGSRRICKMANFGVALSFCCRCGVLPIRLATQNSRALNLTILQVRITIKLMAPLACFPEGTMTLNQNASCARLVAEFPILLMELTGW